MKKQKTGIEIVRMLSILFIALALILFLYNFNILLEPKQNIHSTSRIVMFRWIGTSSAIMIDNNAEFSSPLILNGERVAITELEPGSYFWKTKSGLSPIRKFSIDSAVIVDYEQQENNVSIKNIGNVDILLELFNKLSSTGMAILNLNQEINVSNASEIIASQK